MKLIIFIKKINKTGTAVASVDCGGTVTDWVGPDGTSSSYFSEINNNSVPSNSSIGVVGATNYQVPFSSYTGGLTSWLATGTNSKNQFVQYKAVLESDSSAYFPTLNKTSFLPGSRYALSSTVYSLSSAKINYRKVTKLTVTHSCSDVNSNGQDDDLRYDFSFDGGSSFLAWNGSAWVNSSGFNTASTKLQIDSLSGLNLSVFDNTVGRDIWVRAYLTSTGSSVCAVDNIEVKGER